MRLTFCAFLILAASAAFADEGVAEARRANNAREYLRKTHLSNIADATKELRLETTLGGVTATRYRYRQLYQTIPVTSGILEIESDDAGRVKVVKDSTVPDLSVSLQRTVSVDAAQRAAASHLGLGGTLTYRTELFVYPRDAENDHTRLVWVVNVTDEDDDANSVNASVWIDALTGAVLASYHGLRHSAEPVHTDAATNTYPLYSAWMKSRFIGDDTDGAIVRAGTKSYPWTMQDGCHGIFGNGTCPPTVDSIAGDSYYDCELAGWNRSLPSSVMPKRSRMVARTLSSIFPIRCVRLATVPVAQPPCQRVDRQPPRFSEPA